MKAEIIIHQMFVLLEEITCFHVENACDECFLEIMQIIIYYEQSCAAVNVKIFCHIFGT